MQLQEVTKEDFYKALHEEKRDIMPSIASGWSEEHGYKSEWRDSNRSLFGITQDGDCHGSERNKKFQLAK